MAVRYVKDFEFPSAAGYSKSSPSKVTGQMLAKGGQPKGMMVVIGIGKPRGPVKKAEGGPLTTGLAEDEGRYTEATRNARAQRQLKDFRDKAAEARWAASQARGSDWADKKSRADTADEQEAFARKYADKTSTETGYKKGGKVAKVMHEFGKGKLHSGSKKGPKVTNPKQAIAIALSEAGKSKKAEGGMAHEDVAADKSLIKSMVKPAALKKAMGGQAVQMAKSNAIKASMKGQKKTGYADGGMTGQQIPADIMSRYSAAKAAPVGPLTKMTLSDGRSVTGEKQTVDQKFAPQMAAMGLKIGQPPAGSKSVPVAPRSPMIPQQGAPSGPRIGVGRSRSGKPNVGAIRAAMAKAATKSMPENAPEVMKKGGKVKC